MYNSKRIITWLLSVTLTVGAFVAGVHLRSTTVVLPVSAEESERTYALLKLTPECSPVTPPAGNTNRVPSSNRELVNSVLKLLKIHYVEPITPERETDLARGAVRGLLSSLNDPDSRFLDPEERKLMEQAGMGQFLGIGAVLALKSEKADDLDVTKVVVVAPVPGSPAEKAGLKPGDVITHIDGKWIITHDPFRTPEMVKMETALRNKEIDEFTYWKAYEAVVKKLKEGIQVSEAVDTLTEKSSGQLTLKVERPGLKDEVTMKVACKKTYVRPVTSRMLAQNVGYIRISQFSRQVPQTVALELKKLKSQGAKALVLDLRGNPGGLIDSAAEVTRRFTGGGTVAIIQEKKSKRTISVPKIESFGLPVAVLVDKGTASVAELVAGTLRDNIGATLVGTATFGDGLLQTPLILRDGSAAILTTGKMLTAKGINFEGTGLKPDKTVLESQSSNDNQLAEAEKILISRIRKAS